MDARQALPPSVARRFRTGRPSLDFAHTGGEGRYAVFELLHAPGDLSHWLGLLLGIEEIRAGDDDVVAARALRGAIWRGAQAAIAGGEPDPGDVRTLNAFAEAAPLVPRLSGSSSSIATPASASQALSTLARDAIDLLGGPLAGRIRVCAASDCGLLFLDSSRPGRRRWCSMQRCGNLAKTRAYRGRRSDG